jgi:hypothetical protein
MLRDVQRSLGRPKTHLKSDQRITAHNPRRAHSISGGIAFFHDLGDQDDQVQHAGA